MKLIINPKTKQQEEKVKSFPEDHSIDCMKVEEEAAVYHTKKTIKEKPLGRGKRKSKLISEIKKAANEMRLIRSGKKKARSAEDFLNEV